MLKTFAPSFLVTIIAAIGSFFWLGPDAAAVVLILIVLEVSLSFDNAVVNATVLERMSPWWQKVFLTVGIFVAVFGMRFLFPILIVTATAQIAPGEVLNLAFNDKAAYAAHLLDAHSAIAAFGGAFLMMIALDFIFEDKEHMWLKRIEATFARLGGIEGLSVSITLIVIVLSGNYLDPEKASTILLSGVLGVVTYLLVNGLAGFFEVSADEDDEEAAGISGESGRARGAVAATGKAAFFLFMYLEVLDASFSFDGVIGAFAISNDIVVIALGLGVGALYVRSLTIYLVRQGTLSEYVFLEHGAHYAIGALAVLLFTSMKYEIPEIVTGLIGVAFIFAALMSSIRKNKAEAVS